MNLGRKKKLLIISNLFQGGNVGENRAFCLRKGVSLGRFWAAENVLLSTHDGLSTHLSRREKHLNERLLSSWVHRKQAQWYPNFSRHCLRLPRRSKGHVSRFLGSSGQHHSVATLQSPDLSWAPDL